MRQTVYQQDPRAEENAPEVSYQLTIILSAQYQVTKEEQLALLSPVAWLWLLRQPCVSHFCTERRDESNPFESSYVTEGNETSHGGCGVSGVGVRMRTQN